MSVPKHEDLPIRLIAIDMDGTLLDGDRKIPKENLAAMQAAREKGIHLAICSGRIPEDISCSLTDMGFSDCYVLGLNGGYCLERPHGKPLFMHYMQEETVKACIEIMERELVTYSAFGRNHVAISRPFQDGADLNTWGSNLQRKGPLEYSYGLEGIYRQLSMGTNKIVYIDRDDPIRLERIRAQIALLPGVEVTSSWVDNIEIMPKGINKGMAVAALAKLLHIDAAQVMTLGDHDNDISMLAYAGFGVAMGNASKSARDAAAYETDTNQRFGVAKAIWKYALGQDMQ